MVTQRRPSKDYKSSLRYQWIPPDVQSFDPDKLFISRDVYQQSKPHAKTGKRTETKSSTNTVSTSQFVSAIVGIWDCVGQTEVFQTKGNLKHGEICPKDDFISYSDSQNKRSTLSVTRHKLTNNCSSSVKSDFEDLKTIKKMLCFTFCGRSINNCSLLIDSHSNIESNALDKVTGTSLPNDLGYEYGSMIMNPYLKETTNNFTTDGCPQTENGDTINIRKKYLISNNYSTCGIKSSSTTESEDSSRSENLKLVKNLMHLPDRRCTTYALQPQQAVTSTEESVSTSSSAALQGLQSDYNVGVLTSTDSAFGPCQQSTDFSCVSVESSKVSTSKNHIVHESCKRLIHEVIDYKEDSLQYWLSMQQKLRHAFAGSKHALAGALSGSLVSLCLHPVDTVKTIIQASGKGQKSYDIVKTIISERGVLGLYRGIATNLASSTPISAIYTYTYESVKSSLLPIVPKEYHSFAHCIAGGCSSIATSFVFTPSERIKQQMQVGSRYQNCWNAFIGCLEKGGITSLYTGWGAVLCRNIPHSVIKFYTYESLKQLFVTSSKPNPNLSTAQTLICGGLAGSTAALFTTPFDVVKTRLQTQVPGSLAKYDGVLHALQEIAIKEGFRGLYRGLTPRLAMYVSQGAIFFASYEFLKAVFFLEKPQAPPQVTENEEHIAPAPFRLQKLSS